jgi:Ni/Fe-hydrogenase subunit HybB-like protein
MKMRIAINKRLYTGARSLGIRPLPLVLLAFMGIAFVTAMVRYISGIGAISNLGNSYPWGFWISFDLFTGVAISSGAFLMAAVVYIFELKEFQPLVRPSVLTGFLGYSMVVVALLVDLGHPERIW